MDDMQVSRITCFIQVSMREGTPFFGWNVNVRAYNNYLFMKTINKCGEITKFKSFCPYLKIYLY